MSDIEFVQKDITTVDYGVVAHGVNCQAKMASGVAKYIRAKWPVVYDEYLEFIKCHGAGKNSLGYANIVPIEPNELYVANCFTQEYYGYDGKQYASLVAIESSINSALAFAHSVDLPLYMPLIGGVRGGLDFNTQVLPIVRRLASNNDVHVIVCSWKE